MTIKVPFAEDDKPEGWQDGWNGAATVEWGYIPPEPEQKEEEKHGWLS